MAEVLDHRRLTPDLVRETVQRVSCDGSYTANSTQMQNALQKTGGVLRCALYSELIAMHGVVYITRPVPTLTYAFVKIIGRMFLFGFVGVVSHRVSKSIPKQ